VGRKARGFGAEGEKEGYRVADDGAVGRVDSFEPGGQVCATREIWGRSRWRRTREREEGKHAELDAYKREKGKPAGPNHQLMCSGSYLWLPKASVCQTRSTLTSTLLFAGLSAMSEVSDEPLLSLLFSSSDQIQRLSHSLQIHHAETDYLTSPTAATSLVESNDTSTTVPSSSSAPSLPICIYLSNASLSLPTTRKVLHPRLHPLQLPSARRLPPVDFLPGRNAFRSGLVSPDRKG
jgi:hypothetical protein